MSDPRWQYQPPYPTQHPQPHPHPHPPPPLQQQQPTGGYRPESSGYDRAIQQHSPPPLPQLRPLQPNPYPQPVGYSMYPYPNRHSPQQTLEESEAEKAENRRTRISRACDACRRKKIKCDTSGPGNTCKNCKSSTLECTFNDSAKKRGPPKGYIEVLENRLKRMERILGNLADDEDDQGDNGDGNNQTPGESPSTTSSSSSSLSPKKKKQSNGSKKSNNADVDGDKTMSQIKSNSSSKKQKQVTPMTATAETTAGTMTEKLEEKEAKEVEQKISTTTIVEPSSLSTGMRTRYIGDMSPLPFLAQKINFEDARIASKIGLKIRRFGQSLVLYEKEDRLNGKSANQILLEELNMLKPGESIKGLNDWIYKVAGIDKTTSDNLMKIYFAYIHPGLPVVNKHLFLKQYRGEIGEYPSAPLLNAIYGAAVRYMETCDMNGEKLTQARHIEKKENWSEQLFENLITFVKGRYSPCISTVQALVIAQNHRASLDEKIASGWLLNSAACRMAQDLGLHRSSENWDIPDSEKETRKRVFWSVFIIDKWSSASTGRPQTIFDEDCDEQYPNESADWDEVMDVNTSGVDGDGPRYPSLDKNVAQKAKNEKIPIYQPFVQLVKLSEILGKILQGLYTPLAKKHSEKHGSDAIVTYLDKTLSEWRSNLPPALQISSINLRRLDSHGKTPLLSMSGLMYLSYCTLLILLHRPFIEKEGQKTRSSQSSLSICTSAATRCVDIAEKMHYRDFLLVSWNFAIYPVFTASLIHIYNASNPDSIVSDVAKSNLIKAACVIKRLSKLSCGAVKLYEILRSLMKLRDVHVDTTELSDDEDGRHDNSCFPIPHKKKSLHISTSSDQAQHKGKRRRTSHGAVNADEDTEMTNTTGSNSKVSDVRSGGSGSSNSNYLLFQQNRGSNRDSSAELVSPSTNMHSDSEMASSHSTPSSTCNGDWINGLYSSLQSDNNSNMNQQMCNNIQQIHQQQQQQQSQQALSQQQQHSHNNSLEADPYSLRQFGINLEQMYNTHPNYSSQSMPTNQPQQYINNSNNSLQQQQQSMSAVMLPINPADSFLFGLSDLAFFAPYNIYDHSSNNISQQQQNNSNYSTMQQQQRQARVQQQQQRQQQQMMDQTVFRNRPDNPFWSVPSSIELDDWTAYLLPQQPPPTSTTAAAAAAVAATATATAPAIATPSQQQQRGGGGGGYGSFSNWV